MHKLLLPATLAGLLCSCSASKSNDAKADTKKDGYSSINLEYMDKSVRPQDDFFMFADGTWVKNNPVPPSESRWGSFNELDQENKRKLTGILENASKNPGEKGSMNYILGNYYASFTNMDVRNELGIKPAIQDLQAAELVKSKEDIVRMIAEQHKNGINSLFGFGVGQDLKNVDKNICYFSQGGIGLPNKDYYFAENKEQERKQYMMYISGLLGQYGMDNNDASKAAVAIFEFEKKLASKMMAPAELRIPEKTYNKFSRQKFTELTRSFDMEAYLSALGAPKFDSIVVGQPEFAAQLDQLLQNESMETWKNYLVFKTLNYYAPHLDAAYGELHFNFYDRVLKGKKEMKPLNEQAIDEITGMEFSELLGKAFVEKYFSEKAQQRVNQMVDNLLTVFKERINKLDWMSEATKEQAQLKLSSIGRKLGFPSKWEDFSAVDFRPETYAANVRLANRMSVKRNLAKLNKPVDRDEWEMPAHMVNAYYHPLLNEIAFPAGIMQPPFFDENAEDAVNYGRIGMVIGHEFTHGFDDMGSKFAADGTFTNWWTENDRKLFESKTGIFGETYAAFCPFDGECVNPDLTMGENIADLGGLTLAYHAYTLTDEFKKNEMRYGYTPAQRFFISYAQLWKINYTDAELKNRIANDPHSPGMYRVNGPLMNSPEFFEAFNVKEGDPMRNPVGKVARIW